METKESTLVTVSTTIDAPAEKVWRLFTHPKHIVKWNYASDDWHTPKAENEPKVGGKFSWRMEAKDGSAGFDFSGIYTKIEKYKLIGYTLDDGREVKIQFIPDGNATTIRETFETEHENTMEMQRDGWQSILNHFKGYAESLCKFVSLHFEITINARVEKVYRTMLDEHTYSEWTAEFNPTSHYVGSWEKGARILFLGVDGEGKSGGMIGHVRENIPNRFVSIEYAGLVQDGMEIMDGPEVDAWAGGLENYSFSEVNRKTIVSIDTEANHEFKTYFLETWPKALNKLKEICERAEK
jgi:uncharacterized protein YndB with AHSA1/START domain